MVKFVDVDPRDIPFNREGRRGRVSYPILKSFLETNKVCVKLDRTGVQQSFQALYSMLRAYVMSHQLPIKIFSSGGEIYLMRIDMDAEGNPVANWREQLASTDGNAGMLADVPAKPITAEEVTSRAQQERGKTTK